MEPPPHTVEADVARPDSQLGPAAEHLDKVLYAARLLADEVSAVESTLHSVADTRLNQRWVHLARRALTPLRMGQDDITKTVNTTLMTARRFLDEASTAETAETSIHHDGRCDFR